VFLNFKI